MNVSFEAVGPVTVVKPDGTHLDAARAKEFRRDVIEKLASPSFVLLDLTGIRFIDSSGCGAVLACSRRVNPCAGSPGDLKVCGVTKQVRMVFEMVRIHKVIEIFNTREEAMRSFASGPAAALALAGR
jgi:anti-sigma B factor antagonist